MPTGSESERLTEATDSDHEVRDWAWWRGKTDVILDLDAAAAVATVLTARTWGSVVALCAVVPHGGLGSPLDLDLRRLSADRPGEADIDPLIAPLAAWAAEHRSRLAAYRRDMAVDTSQPHQPTRRRQAP